MQFEREEMKGHADELPQELWMVIMMKFFERWQKRRQEERDAKYAKVKASWPYLLGRFFGEIRGSGDKEKDVVAEEQSRLYVHTFEMFQAFVALGSTCHAMRDLFWYVLNKFGYICACGQVHLWGTAPCLYVCEQPNYGTGGDCQMKPQGVRNFYEEKRLGFDVSRGGRCNFHKRVTVGYIENRPELKKKPPRTFCLGCGNDGRDPLCRSCRMVIYQSSQWTANDFLPASLNYPRWIRGGNRFICVNPSCKKIHWWNSGLPCE